MIRHPSRVVLTHPKRPGDSVAVTDLMEDGLRFEITILVQTLEGEHHRTVWLTIPRNERHEQSELAELGSWITSRALG